MITTDLDVLKSRTFDVCVVGSGPVGLSTAVELSSRGLSVIVLESGLAKPDSKIQTLSSAEIQSPQTHHPMELAVNRSLGGTSLLWGGRCVFLDEIDFHPRQHVSSSGWPIRFDQVSSHLQRAAELLGCDDGPFRSECTLVNDAVIAFSKLERWVNETRIVRKHPDLSSSERLVVVLSATVIGIDIDSERQVADGLRIAREGRSVVFRGAKSYLLALGGIETARLLLNVQTEHPALFGGADGPLGRYYMGHLSEAIAQVRFYRQTHARCFDNIRGHKSFARRIITIKSQAQIEARVPNIAFWPDNANYSDARHRSGLLSAIFLALNSPGIGRRLVAEAIHKSEKVSLDEIWPHLKNIIMDLPATTAAALEIGGQYLIYRRRLPRVFVSNSSGLFSLRFLGEQAPNRTNGIRLSNDRDMFGLRRVVINLKFGKDEIDAVIRAHRILDQSLRRLGIGELVYGEGQCGAQETPVAAAERLDQMKDGLHQIGLTRMADSRLKGVVDRDCKVFDLHNLYIAGSSVFPTSGRATPTLPAVALAVRLAQHIAKRQSRKAIELAMPA